MAEDKIVRLIAEFMDGMNLQDGSPMGTLQDQAIRACTKAKIDPKSVDRAIEYLNKQKRL